MLRFPCGPSQGRARSRSPSRPRFFRRSPLRGRPSQAQPLFFRPRSRSPAPAPAFQARSDSQPRSPQFYRRSPSPYRQRSPPPPVYCHPSPPRASQPPFPRSSPPRFRVSPPRRSPPHAQSRSRSEWRKPSSSSTFQRGKSLARDEFRPPPKTTTHFTDKSRSQWKAKPYASGLLAQHIMTLNEFCAEVLDAEGKLLKFNKRPKSPGGAIPVPLLPGEESAQYELQFSKWLMARRNILVEDLRDDPGKERVFRFSFAYSRLPATAWNNPKAPNSSPGGEHGNSSDDKGGGRGGSRSLANGAMPPRAKPYKRSRSVDPMNDDTSNADADVKANESKRPRRASPRDPRIRVAASDSSSAVKKDPSTVTMTTTASDNDGDGDDIDGEPISDVEAALTLSSAPELTPSAAISRNGTAKEGAKHEKMAANAIESTEAMPILKLKASPTEVTSGIEAETPPAMKVASSTSNHINGDPAIAIAVSKNSGDTTKSSSTAHTSDKSDEIMPKWATALLKRVQDLECEVRDLRRQLATRQPDASSKDIRDSDFIKVDHVDISTDQQQQQHFAQPKNRSASRAARDPVKTRLAAAYNELNDEILLNEKAVAESEQFVLNIMKSDARQARELQKQIQELSAAIEPEKSKRDAALAALIAYCWQDRKTELEAHLASPLEVSDTSAVQQVTHVKCANLAAQVKQQDHTLAEIEKTRGNMTESTAADDKSVLQLNARVAEAEAARDRLARAQEVEFVVLLGASERIRTMVRSLLKATP